MGPVAGILEMTPQEGGSYGPVAVKETRPQRAVKTVQGVGSGGARGGGGCGEPSPRTTLNHNAFSHVSPFSLGNNIYCLVVVRYLCRNGGAKVLHD
jgi:hypothetical protein